MSGISTLLLLLCGHLAAGQDVSGYCLFWGGMDPTDASGHRDIQLVTMGRAVNGPYCYAGAADRLPREIAGYGSAYAIVGGNAMICGGGTFEEATDECYTLTTSGAYGGGGAFWVRTEDMSSHRMFPAFTLMNHTTLWVGGGDGTNRTEIYETGGFEGRGRWRPYVDLPAVRREACLAKINDEGDYLFGGGIDQTGLPSRSFWYFNVETEVWKRVADLSIFGLDIGIRGHSCVPVKSKNGYYDRVLVTGGRYAMNPNEYTFYYQHQSKTWYKWGMRRNFKGKDRSNTLAIPLPRTSVAPNYGFLSVANGEPEILQYTADDQAIGTWVDTGYRVGTNRDAYYGGFCFRHCPFNDHPILKATTNILGQL